MPQMEDGSSIHHSLITSVAADWVENVVGFSHYGFRVAQHERATDFFLLREDSSGLRFSTVMIDLAERLEVGVFKVEAAEKDYFPEELLDLPMKFYQKLVPERLVITTDYGNVDSGLVLKAIDGDELVLVSGVYPYTVEVRAPFFSGRFEPEYSLDKYSRHPMGTKGDGGGRR